LFTIFHMRKNWFHFGFNPLFFPCPYLIQDLVLQLKRYWLSVGQFTRPPFAC
jgi:hypothetical protein